MRSFDESNVMRSSRCDRVVTVYYVKYIKKLKRFNVKYEIDFKSFYLFDSYTDVVLT